MGVVPKLTSLKKWTVIIISVLLVVIVAAIGWERIYIKSDPQKDVFILPEGFKGVVLIAYGQSDGREDIQEDGRLIYKIPGNGILKLKRASAPTIMQSWYYFESGQGKRTEFYYAIDPGEMKRNDEKVYAFGRSNEEVLTNNEKLKITTFLVGRERDRDSLSMIDEKMKPLEMIKESN